MVQRRRATQRGAATVVTMVAVLGTGVATAVPAVAKPNSGDSSASTESTSTRSSDAHSSADRAALGPAQVKKQLAEAASLQKDLRRANAQVAAAGARLAELSARSGAAMSAVVAAKAAEAQAAGIEKRQLALLRTLSTQAAKAKQDVTGMAYDAYVNGPGELRDIATLVRLASESGNQDASLVQYLAGARAAEGRRFTSLAKAQQATARAAVAARLQREAATKRALAGQKQVDQLLAAQRAALANVQKVAGAKSSALTTLGVKTAAGGKGVDLAALKQVVTTPLCTKDTGTYANGAIPASALCPITGAPGHMMRPAAARGLNALKAAYKRDLGTDLCITDTYRSLAAQIDVKARKPVLAATPGTSNHGFGLATDLCGGIESFGTVQHRWMQQHAPLFGFFHPQWAEPNGSKPEPWHWEFAQ